MRRRHQIVPFDWLCWRRLRSCSPAAGRLRRGLGGVAARLGGRVRGTGRAVARCRHAGASTSAPTGATRSSSTTPTARERLARRRRPPRHHRARGDLPGAELHLGAHQHPRASSSRRTGASRRGSAAGRPGHLARVLAARRQLRRRSAGPRAARSTSWSTAVRSREILHGSLHGPGLLGRQRGDGPLHALRRRGLRRRLPRLRGRVGSGAASPGSSTTIPYLRRHSARACRPAGAGSSTIRSSSS